MGGVAHAWAKGSESHSPVPALPVCAENSIRRRRSSQTGCSLRSCALDPRGDAERRAHASYSEVGSSGQCSLTRRDGETFGSPFVFEAGFQVAQAGDYVARDDFDRVVLLLLCS